MRFEHYFILLSAANAAVIFFNAIYLRFGKVLVTLPLYSSQKDFYEESAKIIKSGALSDVQILLALLCYVGVWIILFQMLKHIEKAGYLFFAQFLLIIATLVLIFGGVWLVISLDFGRPIVFILLATLPLLGSGFGYLKRAQMLTFLEQEWAPFKRPGNNNDYAWLRIENGIKTAKDNVQDRWLFFGNQKLKKTTEEEILAYFSNLRNALNETLRTDVDVKKPEKGTPEPVLNGNSLLKQKEPATEEEATPKQLGEQKQIAVGENVVQQQGTINTVNS